MFETLEHIDRELFLSINGCHSPLADSFFWLVSASWIFAPLWIFLAVYIYKTKNLKFLLTALFCMVLVFAVTAQRTMWKLAIRCTRLMITKEGNLVFSPDMPLIHLVRQLF